MLGLRRRGLFERSSTTSAALGRLVGVASQQLCSSEALCTKHFC